MLTRFIVHAKHIRQPELSYQQVIINCRLFKTNRNIFKLVDIKIFENKLKFIPRLERACSACATSNTTDSRELKLYLQQFIV